MALSLSKLEAVKFGDFEVIPKMDREQKLRVQSLKIKEDNLDEAQEVLSNCFGADSSKVKDFMKDNLFIQDYIQLQIYLTQGQTGLDKYNQRLDRAMDKEMERAIEESRKKVAEESNND